MKRLAGLLLGALLGLSTAAVAEPQTIERTLQGKAATDIKVGVFASIRKDCRPSTPPVIRLVKPPAHGKVTVKSGKLRATNFRQCLGVEVPAYVAYYRSGKDFIGEDVFTLEVIGSKGKSQFQRFTVTVAGPGPGQGI